MFDCHPFERNRHKLLCNKTFLKDMVIAWIVRIINRHFVYFLDAQSSQPNSLLLPAFSSPVCIFWTPPIHAILSDYPHVDIIISTVWIKIR